MGAGAVVYRTRAYFLGAAGGGIQTVGCERDHSMS